MRKIPVFTLIFTKISQFGGGQFYQEVSVIVIRGAVTAELAAFGTAVYHDKTLLRVSKDLNRLKLPPTLTGAVAGIDIHVKRPEAVRAVIPRRVSEWLYLPSAVRADKSVVVFRKSFRFH